MLKTGNEHTYDRQQWRLSPRRASSEALRDRLNEPGTVEGVPRLLDRAEPPACSTAAWDWLIRRSETISDNIAVSPDAVRQARPAYSGACLRELATPGIERMAPGVASQEFDALPPSGVFQPATVKLLEQAGNAFVASFAEQRCRSPKRGLLRLPGAQRDPDIQPAAALIVTFGKRCGHPLEQ
ncbi:MAG: hypothetical protein ACUVS4_07970 [Chloroflexaceae bacterium]